MIYKHGGDVFENQIDLDFSININPLGMPSEVAKAIKNAVSTADIYPDFKARKLVAAISKKHAVKEECVVVGNGASELILAIARTGVKRGVIIQPTFSEYAESLAKAGVEFENFVMSGDLQFSLCDVGKIPACDICFLCSPNNPTGRLVRLDAVAKLAARLEKTGGVLVLDECFMDFAAGESCVSIFEKHPNIIAIRALTKSHAMAGVRLGYLLCGKEEYARKIKGQLPMWNVSHLAQRGGEAALDCCDFADMLQVVESGRAYLSESLSGLGFEVYKSDANFILFKAGFDLKTPLLQRGILIRDAGNFVGLCENTFRICVSVKEKNEILIQNIKEIISEREL